MIPFNPITYHMVSLYYNLIKMCKFPRIPTRTRKYQTFISYALSHYLSAYSQIVCLLVCLFVSLSLYIQYAFDRHYAFTYSYSVTCYCSIVLFGVMTTNWINYYHYYYDYYYYDDDDDYYYYYYYYYYYPDCI